ncbi:MAG TPA: bifunctional hydroxymethylpyrimidine kinase/phosphomethylpyrimidine kinase [Bryobacteraceae bacterium]|nr:bifunctional hydroxymethylpyrimidine kinase/phosphomethylpyrimidine kinase [Bryobacteraceae bacterium]
MPSVALTIAGSDPSGGAGIQADLKTFHQFGVYGEAVITLLTVQNTHRVSRVDVMAPDLVIAQLNAVIEDIPPQAAKTGALGNREVVEALAARAAAFSFPLVVDPVMISKHGAPLLGDDAADALRERVIPVATVITPNLFEAQVLARRKVESLDDAHDAARAICDLGARAALVKGGHLDDGGATDVLCVGGEFHVYPARRVDTRHTHGTGCTYSAAITACLALGLDIPHAVARAKRFIAAAIEKNPGLGGGQGPVNHFAETD